MEDLKDARVLVTGSDGFIGSHVVEELVRAGANVKAVVLYNSFNSWGWLDTVSADVMKSVEVIAGDVRDPHFMISAAAGCTDVVHLAALIAIPFSYRAPDSYVETNVRGTVNVLQAARHAGVRRFVQTSTSEVYGSAQFVPIKESHPLVGQSPYSASKIASDQMALSFHASFDMPVVVVRPFNTYGPRQSARAVIPTIISQIASGKRKIRLGAVSPTRDFSFVTDTARGLIAGLTAPAEQSRRTDDQSGQRLRDIGRRDRKHDRGSDAGRTRNRNRRGAASARQQRGGAALGRQLQGPPATRMVT